ncbi:MAG: CoA ester lyase [Phenylobacterium sp.]|uniref:HpcH/HpaI aldolase/citrate lyase family protein n=1 Tax=Phenylobacterium sp. TaxID=1871053 RepID=UPI002732531D|nr:CoA ester lyase [Phenylobacterium sp.]MDP3176001.1 CoA ester lyase [Phenylobacterium sp.]
MPAAARPRRSVLYMPASNARAVDKARTLPCDVVILDLEDAVAPDAKAEARTLAVDAIRAGGFGSREVVLRVNGLDTPWGRDDLAAARGAGADAVLVPKVASAADVAAYGSAAAGVRLWAMIETCAALFALDAIGAAAREHRFDVWVAGTNDLAKELRCRQDVERASLLAPLSLIVAAARAHGLAVLDGVFNGLDDDAGLGRQCEQGAAFGFDGKTLIHPRQIEAANRAFAPSADEVAWARTVVAAFDSPENATKGVLRIDGRMVERLHLEEARRQIAVSEAIAANGA